MLLQRLGRADDALAAIDRAVELTRSTRLRPPRGTMTSIAPPSPASIIPTAARSRVGTSSIAPVGSEAARRPSTSAAWIARFERWLSEPPRRIAALPAFRQSAAASAVTLGRLS